MTAQEVFDKVHGFVAKWEGGYVNNPRDPGGATNHGISLRYLRAQGLAKGDIDGDGDIDADDIKLLSPAAAKALMKGSFWDYLCLGALVDAGRPRLACAIYDTAVNMGPASARKIAQRAVGVADDGIWGPITWAALNTAPDQTAAMRFCTQRWDRYCQLIRRNPSLSVFRRGWKSRTEAMMRFIGPDWPFKDE